MENKFIKNNEQMARIKRRLTSLENDQQESASKLQKVSNDVQSQNTSE